MYTESETIKGLQTFRWTEIEIRKLVLTTKIKLYIFLNARA